MATRFRDRIDAGRRLARALGGLALHRPVVLALPPGGVPIGVEVAQALGAPLDVLVVHKIGAPGRPEYAIGAIAEGGEPLFDHWAVWALGLSDAELRQLGEAGRRECRRRGHQYRRGRPIPPVQRRSVVVVDDGVATGVTAETALRALHALAAVAPPSGGPVVIGPAPPGTHLVVAVPVCGQESLARLRSLAEVVCLYTPDEQQSIGTWYERFEQVGDADVVTLLTRHASRQRSARPGPGRRPGRAPGAGPEPGAAQEPPA